MAGLDFKTPVTKEQEDETVVTHNARLGILLFVVYVLFYTGFMGLSAFHPAIMSTPVLGGLNLAIVYGFLLIAAALVLALIYMMLCKKSSQGSKK
ncbi:MAG TPA: DUF485 domain-containing protein [Bdellovibrionota bacterium]|nr:DUF485 domain-containing protein [Bdellovibrionota bacterium]